MTIRCLIIDDEPLAREGLAQYVDDIDFLELVGTADNPMTALPLIETQQPQLLFLDIEMPKLNGLDFLRSLSQPPLVILTTAFPQYAIESYELDVLDYLLKPITFQRFWQAAIRARKRLSSTASSPSPTAAKPAAVDDRIFIKVDGRTERMSPNEVYYVEAMQNYIHLYTKRGRLTTLLSLRELEEMVGQPHFTRVHKSYLANLKHVSAVDGRQLIINETRVPVSRRKWEEIERVWLEL